MQDDTQPGDTLSNDTPDAPTHDAPASQVEPGKHRATVANGYRWRLIIIAVVCLVYGGFCIKDGAYTYPELQERRAYYESFVAAEGNDPALWAAKAREMGWPIEEPKSIEDKNILTQWVQLAIVLPVGLLHLFLWAKWSRRFVEADDDGVVANGGRAFTWDQVTAVDASRWDRKGIAYIQYDTGDAKGEVVLDDWKMVREPADAIFELLKDNVDEDKIEGLGSASSTSIDVDAAAQAEA